MSEETKITLVKTKELKSTTSVSGVLVNCSNKLWYAVLIMRPARNPWYIKAVVSTSGGRTDLSQEFFSLRCAGSEKPSQEIGIDLLLQALNGLEVPKDKINY
jgi:hypothetical protein